MAVYFYAGRTRFSLGGSRIMHIQFAGTMGELLAILKSLLGKFPAIRAMDVTTVMLEQARLDLRRN